MTYSLDDVIIDPLSVASISLAPVSQTSKSAQAAAQTQNDVTESRDAADDDTTRYTVSGGDTFHGEIDAPDDEDVIALEMKAGYTYYVVATGGGIGDISDPELEFYDSDFDYVGAGTDHGNTYSLTINSTITETGYIHISSYFYGAENTGTYTVEIIEEVGQLTDTAGRLYLDREVESKVDFAYDEDWYKVELEAGYSYVFRLNQDGTAEQLEDPFLSLKNSTGSEVANNNDGGAGDNSVIGYTPATDATYFISAEDAFAGVGSYILTMERETADDVGTKGRLFQGEMVKSKVDFSFDEDWYKVELRANYTYIFDLSQDGTSVQLDDPWLSLRNSTGSELDFDDNDGGGSNARVAYTPTSDGTFFISAEDDYTGQGSYILEMRRDIADNVGTQTGLVAGETVAGSMDYAFDQDWYRLELVAGVEYSFLLEQDGTTTQLYDPYLTLRNSSGSALEYDDSDGGGTNALITFTPTSSGTYFISAEDDYNGLGGYNLTMTGTGGIAGSSIDETLNGTDAAEAITSGSGKDTVNAGDGWDYINAGKDRDTINGEGGNDRILAKEGNDTVHGGDGNDAIQGNFGADTIYGDAGDDEINGGKGADVVYGGDGDDVIEGKEGPDEIYGEGGDDHLSGNAGMDTVDGGAGNDYLAGGQSNDILNGGADDDVLNGNNGWDELYGGDGDDIIFGNSGGDYIDGGAGDDELYGGKSTDTFVYSSGNDRIFDFSLGYDMLLIDDSLGTFASAEDVIALADDSTADTIIDFGNGNILTLEGIGNANKLIDYIDFV